MPRASTQIATAQTAKAAATVTTTMVVSTPASDLLEPYKTVTLCCRWFRGYHHFAAFHSTSKAYTRMFV